MKTSRGNLHGRSFSDAAIGEKYVQQLFAENGARIDGVDESVIRALIPSTFYNRLQRSSSAARGVQ